MKGALMTDKNSKSILEIYQQEYGEHKGEEIPFLDYLEVAKTDASMYASPHERLVKAIGEPKLINTSKDERLGRIFQNRIIRTYPPFSQFFGIEPVIEDIVLFLTSGAQGLYEEKKIMYLLGPVAGGKSSLAERIKELMEQEPFYCLKAGGTISPVFESPLGLFSPQFQRRLLVEKYGIPEHRIPRVMSPWAVKRLREFGGDISCFKVVKMFPSILDQIAIAIVDAGDPNNQDISTLVGKTDIRKIEDFSQNDVDSYSFSGGLCYGNNGMVEFREMFKAPLPTLNPLYFATVDGAYKGTESISVIPFNGIILAHSNEAEWQKFKNNRANDALVDRCHLIRVPYTMRIIEEEQIYQKMINESELSDASVAPGTLNMLAKLSVLSRMKKPDENSTWRSKMRVYDGQNLKDIDPKAKPIHEYQDDAGVNEGMGGISPRFAFRVLAKTYNYDTTEVAANPIHLLLILEQAILEEEFDDTLEDLYLGTFLKDILTEDYKEYIEKEIRTAYLESYIEYGQNIFDRYIVYADHWGDDKDFRDSDTGTILDREALNDELEAIEKPSGIANPKGFRNDVVKFAIKYQGKNEGRNPNWREYAKMREAIEAKMFAEVDDMLPVISFDKKESKDKQKEHDSFVERMLKQGYTRNQVRLVIDWHMRIKKSS